MFSSPATNNINFGLSAEEIATKTDEVINIYKKLYDDIAALKPGEQTFENTIRSIADIDAQTSAAESSIDFMQYVSTSKEIRDASSEASTKLSEFGVECQMRLDVFQSLKQFEENADLDKFDTVTRRLIRHTVRDYERNGLALEEEKRNQLKEKKQEISRLEIEYQKNLNEDNTFLLFTREELDGLPDDFIEGLQKGDNDGQYKVTLQYPDLIPVLRLAKNPETRKKLDFANASKCLEKNAPLLEKTLKLRRDIAKLLGYKTHAHYVLQLRMAKTPETVLTFERELAEKLEKPKQNEIKEWLRLKKEEINSEEEIKSYDWNYYNRLNTEKNFQVDDEKIKEYFPMDVVTDGMLRVYEQVLSVTFVEIENPTVWHESVRLFAVHDEETSEFMGHFYLDLYPRDGKYGHAAAFPLQPRHVFADGTVQHPVVAMVTNFTKPTHDKPSLLQFSEVETYFHEFGHVMHGICTNVPYSRFSGTSVEQDFVEAPSQMLENWCYEQEVLEKLSGHYKNHSETLPSEMLQSIIKAKNADTGLLNSRQIFFGMFDQYIHSFEEETLDTGKLYSELRKKYTGVSAQEGTNAAASFGHLMGGYDAQYYGYLYSQVFSADMFEQFKKSGVLSKETGKRYRDIILAHGGSRDSMDSLVEFLGRSPSQEPFLKSIGVL